MDYTPKTTWKESPKSLLSQPPGQTSSPQGTPTANRRRHGVPRPDSFPIESLASKPLTRLSISDPEPRRDYTQASFVPSEDTMDWTPTLPTPRPYTALNPPLPFKAPKSAAAAVAATATDPSPNLSIFSNLSPTTTTATSSTSARTQLADPKFFPPTNSFSSSAETGLESIFDRAFTISHPPAEVRDLRIAEALQRQEAAEREFERKPARVVIRWRVGMLMLLGCAYALLYLAESEEQTKDGGNMKVAATWMSGMQLTSQQRSVLAFGLAALVTLREIIAPGGVQRELVFTVVQTATTAVLGGVVFSGHSQPSEHPATDYSRGRSALGQSAFAVMGLGQLLLLGRECVRVAM